MILRSLFWLAKSLAGTAIIWLFLFFVDAPGLPNPVEALRARSSPGLIVLAADGSVLRRSGNEGSAVLVDQLPPHLLQAVLATEDRRFYEHGGVDLRGLARAMWANLQAGRVVQGGSTISQQLAKNLYLTPERTLPRKLREVMLALWMEARLDKNEILSLYLNTAYLGAGTYGMEAASRRYFGKSVREVDLTEAAMLAGLLKAPSRYAPTANPELAMQRAWLVLRNMEAAGYLATGEASGQRNLAFVADSPTRQHGGYFSDWIESQLPQFVSRVEGGIVVETTLDPTLQKAAEDAVAAGFRDLGAKARGQQVALVVFDANGAVRAMVGGRSYANGQFNRAVQARRQPGSAFKPFIYLAGLEAGLTPDSIVRDAPIEIDGWRPKNFDGRYRGDVTLEDGLSLSLNTVAVRVARKAGLRRIVDTARRLGITSKMNPDLSLALGTSSLSLLEVTSAYLPFANGGTGVFPHGVVRVRAADGTVLYERAGTTLGTVIEERRVGQMNRMLRKALRDGTGHRAFIEDRDLAGKTGTSQQYRDAWFIGYSSMLVAGVWVGRDSGPPSGQISGGGLPTRIWRSFMLAAEKDTPVASLPGASSASGGLRVLLQNIADFLSGSDSSGGSSGEEDEEIKQEEDSN